MTTSFRSIGFAALTVLFIAALPAKAARNPDRPPMSSGELGRVNMLGETEFDCGTYKGNEAEHAWRRAVNERIQKEVAVGKRVVQGGLDYVYDDVWIIQDDGSLTFSGTNSFDTDFRTYQFAPAGGGVYNITNPVFSYDSVLGTDAAPGDDGAELIGLDFTFPFGGSNWTSVWVSGNGILSFGLPPNPSGFFDPADFYSPTDKIAGYYMDLDETAAGGVNVKSEATKFTVTWAGVPEYGVAGPLNTFQIVLYPSGNFTLTYNGMQTTIPSNANPIVIGFHPGGTPNFEVLSFNVDVPYTSGAGAAVYEEYYSFGYPLVNEVALFQRFYSQFPDEFFQLVYFTNFIQTMSGFANELNIKNDVTGLGLDIFDSSAQYGSNGVLESRCNMNRTLAWMSADPYNRWFSKGNNFLTIMGQEAGHRWGAFTFFDSGAGPSNLILGRSDAHWSYYVDVDHSSLEGGNWESVGGGNYICPTRIDYFSELDEYLMGLRTPEEVKDFYYISSPANDLSGNRSIGTPMINANASGIEVPVTVEDIAAANGARTPIEPNENKDLRQAFILLVQAGTSPTQADLDKISAFRRAWEDYFEVSCDGRLTCNTSLTSNFPVAVVCGNVRDAGTNAIIPEFTARSLERGFVQHVPDGGRYTVRYQANAASGPEEHITIVFEAANYDPDTVVVNVAYGSTSCADVLLDPTLTPVFITRFEAIVVDGPAVDVRWELWSDEALSHYELFRHDNDYTPARMIASGDASARSFVDETVKPGASYRYELVVVAEDGERARSQLASVTMPALVTALAQNYPNPFNPKTTIEYTLSKSASVAVGIYDATGALVIRFDQGTRDAGPHRVEWNGNDADGKPVGSGVYFYRLEGVKGIAPRKMVLLK